MQSSAKPKIGIVGALRGFAALAVCWFHFTFGQNWWLKWSGTYGWAGVHVFFVISGFIISYSLFQYRYTLRDYHRFIAKRLVRLHPPYLASIVLVLALVAATILAFPHANIPRPEISARQFLSHFFYLNDFLGLKWFNVVYWTLSIELQWYLLLGLAFPLLGHRNARKQLAGALLLLLGYRLVPSQNVIFHSVPIFLIGVFVFQYKTALSGALRMLASIAAMAWLMWRPIGHPVTVVATTTGLLIAFFTLENRWCNRLGEISYSLYLLHIPIGLNVIGLLSKLPFSGELIALVDLIALAASIYASTLFYRWIESPSQTWSSAIKIKPRPVMKKAEDFVAEPVGAD